MNCPRCQTINPDGAVTCASCGAPLMMGQPPPQGMPMGGYPPPMGGGYPPPMGGGYPPPGQPYMMMQPMGQPSTSGMAIAGFILSFLCPILGLIFSIIGYNQVKNSGGMKTGGGLAMAGIIISCLMFLLNIMIMAGSK
jgi:hypothetical protein